MGPRGGYPSLEERNELQIKYTGEIQNLDAGRNWAWKSRCCMIILCLSIRRHSARDKSTRKWAASGWRWGRGGGLNRAVRKSGVLPASSK